MYAIVITYHNRVYLIVLVIHAVGVVPHAIDKLATLVILAEQETIEGMQASVALTLTPRTSSLVFVGRVSGTLNVAGIACRLLGKGYFKNGVVIVNNLIVALVDKYRLVFSPKIVTISRDDGVCIVTGYLVVLFPIVRALHSAIISSIGLVGAQGITTSCQGDTCYHCLGKLLRATLYGDATGR